MVLFLALGQFLALTLVLNLHLGLDLGLDGFITGLGLCLVSVSDQNAHQRLQKHGIIDMAPMRHVRLPYTVTRALNTLQMVYFQNAS